MRGGSDGDGFGLLLIGHSHAGKLFDLLNKLQRLVCVAAGKSVFYVDVLSAEIGNRYIRRLFRLPVMVMVWFAGLYVWMPP